MFGLVDDNQNPITPTKEQILETKQYLDSEVARYWSLSKPYPLKLLAAKFAFEKIVNDGFLGFGEQLTADGGKEIENVQPNSN